MQSLIEHETLVFWQSPSNLAEQPLVVQDFAGVQQSADKVVFSKNACADDDRQDPDRADLDPRIRQQRSTP